MTSVALSSNIMKNFRSLCRQVSTATSYRGAGLTVRPVLEHRKRTATLTNFVTFSSTRDFCSHGALYQVSQAGFQRRTQNSKQSSDFALIVRKLDDSHRRLGIVRKSQLQQVMRKVVDTGFASPNQALLLIRSCGSMLAEVKPEDRIKLVHHFWDQLKNLGTTFDTNHYNTLLSVYLQNEHDFSPSEFLASMEKNELSPNRVTYQRIIAAYCNKGDVTKATEILQVMKTKELPVTEGVFNSLITGHAKAGEMDKAKSILDIMKNVGLEPTVDSYTALMVAHAESGNIEELKQVLAETAEIIDDIPCSSYLTIAHALGMNGHTKHISEILDQTNLMPCVPEAINASANLVVRDREEAAFEIVKYLKADRFEGEGAVSGGFYLDQIAQKNLPSATLLNICDQMKELGLHDNPFPCLIEVALRNASLDYCLELFKGASEKSYELRPHYFWPLFARFGTDNEISEHIVSRMKDLGVQISPETYSLFILPNIQSTPEELIEKVKELNLDDELFPLLLRQRAKFGDLQKVAEMLKEHKGVISGVFPSYDVITAFFSNPQVEPLFECLQVISERAEDQDAILGKFLYGLLKGASELPKSHKLKPIIQTLLTKLADEKIWIGVEGYRGLTNLHESDFVSEMLPFVFRLVPKEKVESGDFIKLPTKALWSIPIEALEEYFSILKEKNSESIRVLRQLILSYAEAGNYENTMSRLQEYEELGYSPNGLLYAKLIGLCAKVGRMEEALKHKETLSNVYPDFKLDIRIYLNLMVGELKEGRKEEAFSLFHEAIPQYTHDNKRELFLVVDGLCREGLMDEALEVLDKLVDSGITPKAEFFRPLVISLVERNDFDGALELLAQLQAKYNFSPGFHEYLTKLVEIGDTEAVQKAVGFISGHYGESNMLHNLCFAFLSAGKIKEAKKIVDTEGFVPSELRLTWFANKSEKDGDVDALLGLIEVTKNFYGCDREYFYFTLIRRYAWVNDVDKALDVLFTMQEEEVIPSGRTLRYLANVLKSNGKQVPFQVPEVSKAERNEISAMKTRVDRDVTTSTQDFDNATAGSRAELKMYTDQMWQHLKDGDIEQALELKSKCLEFPHFRVEVDLMGRFVAEYAKKNDFENSQRIFDEAMKARMVLQRSGVHPLANLYAEKGDMEGLLDMKTIYENTTKRTFPAMGSILKCHYIKDGFSSALQYADSLLLADPKNVFQMGLKSFFKVLYERDEPLDQIEKFAVKHMEDGLTTAPLVQLMSMLIANSKLDEVMQLIEKCKNFEKYSNVVEASAAVMSTEYNASSNTISLIQHLLDSTKENSQVNRSDLYSYQMRACDHTEDYEKGVQIKELMAKEGLTMDKLTLKRLGVLLQRNIQEVPFDIPTETFRELRQQLKQHDNA